MNNSRAGKTLAGLGGAALVAALASAPSAALAVTEGDAAPTHVHPTESIAACEVADATLTWGTLERWRAYIQGSIAQGGWSEEGDVTYEMPNFVWTNGTGITAVDGTAGTVNFEGSVRFSGHDDLLQVNVENPTLELVDASEAYLLLDLSSTKQDGTEDVSATQVRAVKLDIAGAVSGGGDAITFAEVEGDLTAEGAAAFGGFYSAGEAVDPLTIEVTAANGCEFVPAAGDADGGSAETPESTAPEDGTGAEAGAGADADTDAEAASSSAPIPWLPIGIGGAALIVIAVAVTMLVMNRKRE